MEVAGTFICALLSASSSPAQLTSDCKHVLLVLKADSSRLDELTESLAILEQLKKTPQQYLDLAILIV